LTAGCDRRDGAGFSWRPREKGFDVEEAEKILFATLRKYSDKISIEMAALRWFPRSEPIRERALTRSRR
jgi:hypothetical protein